MPLEIEDVLSHIRAAADAAAGAGQKVESFKNYLLDAALAEYSTLAGLTELSTQEKLRSLATIREAYAVTGGEIARINSDMYKLERSQADEAYTARMQALAAMKTGDDNTTNYAAILNAAIELGQDLERIYSEYPVTLGARWQELNEFMVRTTEQRNEKIANAERELFTQSASLYTQGANAYEDLIKFYKAMEGLEFEGSPFVFSADMELEYVNAMKAQNKQVIDLLESYASELTGYEQQELDKRREQQEQLNVRIVGLEIQKQKELQAAINNETKNRVDAINAELKAYTDANDEKIRTAKQAQSDLVAAEKAATNAYIAEIKNRGEQAARAYQEQIRAIEEQLKALERQYEQEDFDDTINRLKARLMYETDDANKYELNKEIENKTTERERTLAKQALVDEKDRLTELLRLARGNADEQITIANEILSVKISAINDEYGAYIQNLEQMSKDAEESAKRQIDLEKRSASERISALNTHFRDRFAASSRAYFDERRLSDENTRGILTDLLNHSWEFEQIGREWGSRLASAYLAELAAAGIAASNSYDGSPRLGTGISTDVPNYRASSNSISITNNFNQPISSPSEVARETRDAVGNILRL